MTQKPQKRPTAQDKREEALKKLVTELSTSNSALRQSLEKLHANYHAVEGRNEEQEALLGERSAEIRELKDDLSRAEKTASSEVYKRVRVYSSRDMWRGAAFAMDAVKAFAMDDVTGEM